MLNRSLVLVATVVALCFGALGSPEVSASGGELKYQNRSDDERRDPPIPHYIVTMSADDELCDKVAEAFNGPTTKKGVPAHSLYRDAMFLKWQQSPLRPKGVVINVDFAHIDLFNEGESHLFARIRLFQGRGYTYRLCEFSDPKGIEERGWKTAEDVLDDPACKYSTPYQLYQLKAQAGRTLTTFTSGDLNRLSPEAAKGRFDLTSPSSGSNRPEINAIVSQGLNLVVLRNLVTDVTLVTAFKGATGENVCVIGPDARVKSSDENLK